jgi:methionyl-tRNA formyltransferase
MGRAVMNGDGKTGVCLILMDEGVDTGAEVMRREIPLPQDMTLGELESEVSAIAPEMVLEYLAAPADPVPQSGEPSYAPKFSPVETRIDWLRPAREIHDKIRALSPSPGAWFMNGGDRVKALRSTMESGRLRLITVQKAGGRPMPFEEFARGNRVTFS